MERVSKKDETLFNELKVKYPKYEYRISKRGNTQRKFNKTWLTVCKHNRQYLACKDCGSKSYCQHNKIKRICKECKGNGICPHGKLKGRCREKGCDGRQYCIHDKLKTFCKECQGGSMCLHGKTKTFCPDPACGGGRGLCRHLKPRSTCKDPDCFGGGSYCSHGKKRSLCPDPDCKGATALCSHLIPRRTCRDPACGGGQDYCLHGARKYQCKIPECKAKGICVHGKRKARCNDPVCGNGKDLCIVCFTKHKKVGKYCYTCHPDYVKQLNGKSKMGCECICKLQVFYNTQIQHCHYDHISKTLSGSEYTISEYKSKKVDGFYVNPDGQKIVIEFLGNYFHGHPTLWGPDEDKRDSFGRLHKDNFYNTERIFTKVASFGYIVRYVWESDYKNLKGLSSVESILREFKGKLEY